MNLFVGQEDGRRPSSRCPLALPLPRSPQVTPAGGGAAGWAAVPLNSIRWFTSPPSPCNNYSRAVAPPPAPRGLPAWAPPISARPRHSEGNETRRKGKKKFGEERAGPAGAAGPAQVRERGGAGAAGPGLRWRLRTATGRGDGGRPPTGPGLRRRGCGEGSPFVPPTPSSSGRGAAGRQRARGPRLFLCLFWWFRPPLSTPGGRLRAQEPSRGRGVCTRVLGWKGEAEPALRQRCARRARPRALRTDRGASAPRWSRRRCPARPGAPPARAGPRCPSGEPSAAGLAGVGTGVLGNQRALCVVPLFYLNQGLTLAKSVVLWRFAL